jgi:hypothetical protein
MCRRVKSKLCAQFVAWPTWPEPRCADIGLPKPFSRRMNRVRHDRVLRPMPPRALGQTGSAQPASGGRLGIGLAPKAPRGDARLDPFLGSLRTSIGGRVGPFCGLRRGPASLSSMPHSCRAVAGIVALVDGGANDSLRCVSGRDCHDAWSCRTICQRDMDRT